MKKIIASFYFFVILAVINVYGLAVYGYFICLVGAVFSIQLAWATLSLWRKRNELSNCVTLEDLEKFGEKHGFNKEDEDG